MADLLADVGELSAFIGEDLDEDLEELLLELATASVQAAAGQRIVEITGETVDLVGSQHQWLQLHQRPVSSVGSVSIDGSAVTDYRLIGSRLWRRQGWVQTRHAPSVVTVTYTHGYPPGDQGLQFAKQITLLVAAQIYANPNAASGFGIDDYREQYSSAAGGGAGEVPESLRKTLRLRYGLGLTTLAAV